MITFIESEEKPQEVPFSDLGNGESFRFVDGAYDGHCGICIDEFHAVIFLYDTGSSSHVESGTLVVRVDLEVREVY